MNIVIVGSEGYIASHLCKVLALEGHTVIDIDRNLAGDMALDLERAEEFSYGILGQEDFVLFTAAVSEPDKCADEFELCWKINVEGTQYFIREAIQRGCRVLFFSSDAVYGDSTGYIYTEESKTSAVTAYGRMKKAVEDAFCDDVNFKSIRLSYVMSAKDRFISYCLDCMRSGKTADVFHPFYRNVVSVKDVVHVVSWFVKNFDEYGHKALNVAGTELVSRVRMADELNRIFDNRLNYRIVKPDGGFFRNRPMITQMKSLYMEEHGILKYESFTEKILREMEGIKL